NTPIEFLVEEGDVSLDILYLTLDTPWPEVVPEHDVMLVAVAESDANQLLLQRMERFVADWPRPVLNQPSRIARLTRDGVYAALRDVPGLDVPITVRVPRAAMREIAAGAASLGRLLDGADFPVIVRPLGSHAGQQLEKVDSMAALTDYLS